MKRSEWEAHALLSRGYSIAYRLAHTSMQAVITTPAQRVAWMGVSLEMIFSPTPAVMEKDLTDTARVVVTIGGIP